MIVPPPLAFAVLTAATRPAAPPPGPEHGTMLTLEARAVAPPRTATTADAATTANALARLLRERSIPDSLLSAAKAEAIVWPGPASLEDRPPFGPGVSHNPDLPSHTPAR